MEIEFADSNYDRLEVDASYTGKFSSVVIKAYRKRIQLIRSAADERDFYALKSLHFERLVGDREGQHSMRLNDQWRLILEIRRESEGKIVVVISIADYH